MKQNLLVVSYDYHLSRQVASCLADVFSMRFCDQKELFEFDHIPLTFSEVYQINGADFINKEMKGTIKMATEFENVVFVADISMADDCSDLFYALGKNNLIIMLKKDIDDEIEELSNRIYDSPEASEFFKTDKELLMLREEVLSESLADIVVDITGTNADRITENVVDKIKKYYSVN